MYQVFTKDFNGSPFHNVVICVLERLMGRKRRKCTKQFKTAILAKAALKVLVIQNIMRRKDSIRFSCFKNQTEFSIFVVNDIKLSSTLMLFLNYVYLSI